MIEIWKDIPYSIGKHQVSNFGNVKSLDFTLIRKDGKPYTNKGRNLSKSKSSNGYLTVRFSEKTHYVHVLVGVCFLNHTPCGFEKVINHKNFNKHDNTVDNLEIVTSRVNCNLKHIKHTSKYTGVSWNKNLQKWNAKIWIDKKLIHLGFFDCEEVANQAYVYKLNLVN